MTTAVLPLPLYRSLLALDAPWRAPVGVPEAERAALVLSILRALEGDGTDEKTPPRKRLQALLTRRRPEPAVPDEVMASIDRLLQGERRGKDETEARSLLRLSRSFGPQANRCALWLGDITTLSIDAITNAANEELLGCFTPFHACVDHAIHCAAGPRLREDCGKLMAAQGHPEPAGFAKVTRAYNLPARFVLHTVGPSVAGVLDPLHERQLASCYRAVLDAAAQVSSVRSVALCAVSTGVGAYPKAGAARVALKTVAAWLAQNPGALELVVFSVFSGEDERVYLEALEGGAMRG